MKIYDCFMYFDEEQILDLRFNILYDQVDFFVIVESTFNHNGESRKLLFNQDRFSKFKNKKVTGKINLNIESIMAAKVLRNRGGLRMGDLKTLGRMTDARLKAVQQEKDSKKRVKPARPEKVYQPRI